MLSLIFSDAFPPFLRVKIRHFCRPIKQLILHSFQHFPFLMENGWANKPLQINGIIDEGIQAPYCKESQ